MRISHAVAPPAPQARASAEARGPRPSVVSIGVFDGVHRGHLAILETNVDRARHRGLEATVVTFQDHPKRLLLGKAPRTLTSLEHRLQLFARAGIQHTLALPFDRSLRLMPWRRFIDEICVAGLGARRFVLGFDSRFGKDREGTPESLRAAGYDVEVAPKVLDEGRAVSSTAIREAVELGDLATAARMLGRPVAVLGTVIRGQALGRQLGFPTANIDPHHELHPPVGVYACRVRILTGLGPDQPLPAVANIGFRPTVTPGAASHPRLEVHLLDWEGELVGRRLEVLFLGRLRGEQRFESLDALKTQIKRDCQAARDLLANSSPSL